MIDEFCKKSMENSACFVLQTNLKNIPGLRWHREFVRQLEETVGQMNPRFAWKEKEKPDLGSHPLLEWGRLFPIAAQPHDIAIPKRGNAG
jgi:hypothetical protein